MDLLSGLDGLAAGPFAYAIDDGMAFPGWVPPLLSDAEAKTGYAAGERVAVLAGEPVDPVCGLVLDRRNKRLSVRLDEPAVQLAYSGDGLVLNEARWPQAGRELWARRAKDRLQVATRAPGAVVWTEEWLAHDPGTAGAGLDWPEFGEWAALPDRIRGSAQRWIADGALDLVDADGWMLEALEGSGALETWVELGRKYDAPRAFGLPAEVQAKLAEPLGWQAAGRKWRLADTVAAATPVSVVSDAVFTAGAGASGEIVTTVQAADTSVTLDLPSAAARSGSGADPAGVPTLGRRRARRWRSQPSSRPGPSLTPPSSTPCEPAGCPPDGHHPVDRIGATSRLPWVRDVSRRAGPRRPRPRQPRPCRRPPCRPRPCRRQADR